MAKCQCGADLPGRRRKCDACKKRPGRAAASTDAAAPADGQAADTIPAGLHDRGRELWVSLNLTLDAPAGQLALEACRMADRLDELDRIIAGKGVLNLLRFRLKPSWWDEDNEQHVHVKVEFSSVLSEARQQQNTLRLLLHEISSAVSPAARPAPTKTEPTQSPKKTPVDEVTARRQARRR